MLAAAAGSESISARTFSGSDPHSPSRHVADLLPGNGRHVVAKRGEALLQVRRLVRIEPWELDRREDLAGLHRGAAHHGELVDERVDRGHHAVAATPLLVGLVACASRADRRPSGPRHRPQRAPAQPFEPRVHASVPSSLSCRRSRSQGTDGPLSYPNG
jgi:hypothetical protein